MKLPENSIGPTDIIAYRECERRMSYGMKRHTAKGEQSHRRMPEAAVHGAVWARGYGSAIHVAIQAVEEGNDVETAVQIAWDAWGHDLDPEDVQLLRDDLKIYHDRDVPGTKTIASEDEIRVPLLVHEGEQIYFRTRVDRLYEVVASPGTFIHVDYKSSKWAKSKEEVHEDLQLWMTNWAIHEFYSECEQLHQVYDQLRYGQESTRKQPAQRKQIREWIEKQVRAILGDENWQPDGLLPYRYNRWCKWCPILESCGVVEELADFALLDILEAAPVEKVGRRKVVQLEEGRLEEYVELFEKAKGATGVLERFADAVKDVLREMPSERRAEAGYQLRERLNSVFTPQAAQRLHDALGDRFYEVVKITKTSLDGNLVEDDDLREWALSLAEPEAGSAALVPIRGA